MQTPTSDPNDPSYQQKLIQALMSGGGTDLPMPTDPTDPTHGAEPGGFAGETKPNPSMPTTTPTNPVTDASAKAASDYDTTGLDPNNPIDAVFIKNKYKQNGQGSGFGDLAYWRAHPDQAARLDADQQGHGHDTPGPGDTGNTSDGSNAAMFGGGGGGPAFGVNPLSFLTGGQNATDPMDTIMSRILAALGQYGGG